MCDMDGVIMRMFISLIYFFFISHFVCENHLFFFCEAMIDFHIEWLHHNLPFCSLADGYLGCFQFFAIKINAAINISAYAFSTHVAEFHLWCT